MRQPKTRAGADPEPIRARRQHDLLPRPTINTSLIRIVIRIHAMRVALKDTQGTRLRSPFANRGVVDCQ